VDCGDIGSGRSGVYAIYPKGSADPLKVFCFMQIDEAGWTVSKVLRLMITHLVSSKVCEAFGDGQQYPQYRLISLDKQTRRQTKLKNAKKKKHFGHSVGKLRVIYEQFEDTKGGIRIRKKLVRVLEFASNIKIFTNI
jgi:hypothetical protein